MKFIAPIHVIDYNGAPGSVQSGFKKFYLQNGYFKLFDGSTISDLVLDRPLDNFTPLTGIVTSSDTVLTALEKLQKQISTFVTPPIPSLQQVVDVNNGISNYGGVGTADIQSTNFSNNRTLYLNNDNFATIKIEDNLNANHYVIIDIDTINLNGTSYLWSNIVAPPAIGPGTINRVSKFNTTTTITDSIIEDNGASVIINRASGSISAYTLDVDGTLYLDYGANDVAIVPSTININMPYYNLPGGVPDASVVNINGKGPLSNGTMTGYFVNVNGPDNAGFFADLQNTSSTSRGLEFTSHLLHTGHHFRLKKEISTGVYSDVFTVGHLGDTTAKSFIKIGGTSSEYLMADGSVSTAAGIPNLDAVLAVGDTGTGKNITLTLEGNALSNYGGTITSFDYTTGNVGNAFQVNPIAATLSDNTGYTSVSRNSIIQGDGMFSTSLIWDNVLSNEIITIPNATGIIALTSNIPTVGTWGALNYPTWVSGTPFVTMTAAGTFALDNTSYYPSSNPAGFVSSTYVASNFYPLLSNPAGYLTSSSLSGYVPYTGATNTVNLNSQNLYTTGKIYIGTTTDPGYGKLIVKGGDIAIDNNKQFLSTRLDGFVLSVFKINTSNQLEFNPLFGQAINDYLFTFNGSEKMRITSTGSVGIGTTTLTQKFNVYGGAGRFDNIGTQLVLGTQGTAGAYEFSVSTGNVFSIALSGTGERMVIAANGNVGIGTTSPSEKFHVNGNARITGAIYDSANLPGTSGQVLSSTGTGTSWINFSPSGYVPYTGATGNVNIGTHSIIADNGVTNTEMSPSYFGVEDAATTTYGLLEFNQLTLVNPTSSMAMTATGITFPNASVQVTAFPPTGGTTAQYIRGDGTLATFPTIPTVGTWGALNYPTWVSGTPFVKMTAVGTFALDTTAYYPNSNPSGFITSSALSGYVPTSRTLTINGVTYDLSANRSWTIATGVTSVTATSPITSSGGATPVISTSMATNKLIGRSTAGTGVMEEITIGTGLTLSGGTLNASATYTSPLTTKGDIFVRSTIDTRLPVGTDGQILVANSSVPEGLSWQDNYANWTSVVKHIVKNNGLSGTITKGTAVYVTSSDGTNMLVGRASNTSEATSSKTMGLMQSDITTTGGTQTGFVITEGLLSGLNTAGQTAGDPVWLGVNGALIYGLINKPYAPAHLVFIGIVTKVSAGNGEIFVKVQNGFELREIHDVDLITTTPINGHILGFDGTLWVNKTIAGWLGFTPANASGTTNYVSKFTGTTTLGNSLIYDNGTNVGIGTTSPNGKLEVLNSGLGIILDKYTGGFYGAIYAGGITPSGTNPILLGNSTKTFLNVESGGSIALSIGTSEKLNITSAGNVGIGTSTPSANLDIVSTTSIPTLRLAYVPVSGYGGGGNIDFVGGTSDYVSGAISWKNGSTTRGKIDYDGVLDKMTISSELTLSLVTNLAERLKIDGFGNVGIGVSSPTYKLHVRDTSALQISVDGGGTATEGIQSVSGGQLAVYDPVYYNWRYGPLTMNPVYGLITYVGQDVLYGYTTAGYIPKKNTTGVQDSNIYDNGTTVGIGTSVPNASAILDLTSTVKGFLPPRMTTTQRNGISSPTMGLLVYDTSLLSLYQYNGTAWVAVGSGGGGGLTPVKLTSQTLTAASWTLSGGYYTYSFSNVNVTATCDVSVTPQNASYLTAYNAQVLPFVGVAAGVATFYSQFPPQANMVVDIVITQTT